jgi:hypothetical protein
MNNLIFAKRNADLRFESPNFSNLNAMPIVIIHQIRAGALVDSMALGD